MNFSEVSTQNEAAQLQKKKSKPQDCALQSK